MHGARVFLYRSITSFMFVVVIGSMGSCEEHVPTFITTPPKMPEGYVMVYTHKYREILKKTPQKMPYESEVTIISHDVIRVGAVGSVIYGIRKHPDTGKKTAFIVDTESGDVTKGLPPAALQERLHEAYQITDPPLVLSRFYRWNSDGGTAF